MKTVKVNEQIAFLRKQKGITQEELAQTLGVTNQSVSKWESGICCPDIQLLPEIASFFHVSVDELLGYQPSETFGDVYLKIKSLFQTTEKADCFELAYKLGVLLTEGAMSKGYKEYVPWNTEAIRNEDDDFRLWGSYTACSEPEGHVCVKQNSLFISDNKDYQGFSITSIKEVFSILSLFCDFNNLKVFLKLYDLTVSNPNSYATYQEISEKCNLSFNAVESALDRLPVIRSKDNNGFRIEGSQMHIPPMLMMLTLRS